MNGSSQERLDALFEDFTRRFHLGEGPDALEYLQRAGTGADDLASRISRFLAGSVPPEPSEERVAEMLREPAFALVSASSYGELLRRARENRHQSRAAFASELAGELGVEARQDKVKLYYADLENGLLSPQGLDRRVREAVTNLLGLPRRQLKALANAWSPPKTRGEASAVFARTRQTTSGDARRSPETGWDEVDRLFLGEQ